MNFYGRYEQKVELDVTDRIGIRELVISLKWINWDGVDTEAARQRWKPAPPEMPGGMLMIGDETRREGSIYKTTWSFEGINGDGRTVTFRTRANSLDYGFEPSFETTDIRKHPRIQQLMDQYGGVLDPASGEIIWPLTISTGDGGSRSGFQGNTTGEEKPNPMFGRNDYFNATGVYTYRYAALTPPTQGRTGRVVETPLVGDPPTAGADRNWLVGPSPFRRRGIVYDITEIYFLSPEGGWPTPIHKLLKDLRGDTPGGGLSSGGLTTGNL